LSGISKNEDKKSATERFFCFKKLRKYP